MKRPNNGDRDWRDELVDRVAKQFHIINPESIRLLRVVARLGAQDRAALTRLVAKARATDERPVL